MTTAFLLLSAFAASFLSRVSNIFDILVIVDILSIFFTTGQVPPGQSPGPVYSNVPRHCWPITMHTVNLKEWLRRHLYWSLTNKQLGTSTWNRCWRRAVFKNLQNILYYKRSANNLTELSKHLFRTPATVVGTGWLKIVLYDTDGVGAREGCWESGWVGLCMCFSTAVREPARGVAQGKGVCLDGPQYPSTAVQRKKSYSSEIRRDAGVGNDTTQWLDTEERNWRRRCVEGRGSS